MAKIGSKIQETRLRKGLTLERIADDTNISIRFLSKIENDDFSGFPGEPYVIGFIRNYAEYLGLDPDVMIARYRNKEADSSDMPSSTAGAQVAAATGAQEVARAAEAQVASAAEAKVASAAEAKVAATKAVEAQAASMEPAKDSADAGEAATVTPEIDEVKKPKKTRKAKPIVAATMAPATGAAVPASPALSSGASGASGASAVPDATAMSGASGEGRVGEPHRDKTKHTTRHVVEIPAAVPPAPPLPARKDASKPTLRTIIVAILAISIVAVALLWIVAGGRTQLAKLAVAEKKPAEYRVEGSPFEMRLYMDDSLLVPVGSDVYKLRLASIGEKVIIETPFGPFELALGETGPLDTDSDGTAEASVTVGDFEKNRAASGALLKVEFAPAELTEATEGEVTIPETQATAAAAANAASPKTDTVIIKSTRGPYPFVVQATFRGNCLFRYEADRKEWVEKYFSKGESITLNVNNGLTVWASNAQAVKLSFQASGGKTADLEIGAPGEIAVKKIAWTRDGSSWALISSNLD